MQKSLAPALITFFYLSTAFAHTYNLDCESAEGRAKFRIALAIGSGTIIGQFSDANGTTHAVHHRLREWFHLSNSLRIQSTRDDIGVWVDPTNARQAKGWAKITAEDQTLLRADAFNCTVETLN